MDRIVELNETVKRVVAEYKGPIYQARMYYVQDDHPQIHGVIVVPDLPRPFPARVVVMVRIVGEQVVIEEDTTDRPLADELICNGNPREQLVLAYAAETLPHEAVA